MSAGTGQLVACAVKQVFVAVSQQVTPLEGGGQLFWHWVFVVHELTHVSVVMSSVGACRKFARSGVGFDVGGSLLPQPPTESTRPTAKKRVTADWWKRFLTAFTQEGLHYRPPITQASFSHPASPCRTWSPGLPTCDGVETDAQGDLQGTA